MEPKRNKFGCGPKPAMEKQGLQGRANLMEVASIEILGYFEQARIKLLPVVWPPEFPNLHHPKPKSRRQSGSSNHPSQTGVNSVTFGGFLTREASSVIAG